MPLPPNQKPSLEYFSLCPNSKPTIIKTTKGLLSDVSWISPKHPSPNPTSHKIKMLGFPTNKVGERGKG